MDALRTGAVDLYPEYTGTVLLVMLQPEPAVIDRLKGKDQVYDYVQQALEQRLDLTFLPPLGFNNTTALMMREEQAEQLNIKSISALKAYVNTSE